MMSDSIKYICTKGGGARPVSISAQFCGQTVLKMQTEAGGGSGIYIPKNCLRSRGRRRQRRGRRPRLSWKRMRPVKGMRRRMKRRLMKAKRPRQSNTALLFELEWGTSINDVHI